MTAADLPLIPAAAPGARTPITLRRHELAWVLEQCGTDDWPYPLAGTAWPADTEEETAAARTRAEDTLRARGLLAPGPAAALLAVGEAVRDRRRQVDLVRRSATTPRAAVALGDDRHGALLVSADHAGAPVQVAPVPADGLVTALLAVLPGLPAAPGTALGLAGTLGTPTPGTPETRRRADERRAVDAAVETATAWSSVGVAAANGVTSARERACAPMEWLDCARGRYRLRHDPPQARAPGPGERGGRVGVAGPGGSRGPGLVPDDARSPAVRAELEAALAGRLRPAPARFPGRSTGGAG